MSCKSCGKVDHQRSTSSKCENRKRRIRETELKNDEAVSVYCIKKGLRSFICPLLEPQLASKLLNTIKDDVKALSRLSIEMSYFVNYFFMHYYNHEQFHVMFPKFDPLPFTYVLKGKSAKLLDPLMVIPKYLTLNKHTTYGMSLRTFNIMAIAVQCKTILETNIQLHAFRRIKRYLNFKFSNLTRKEVHDVCFDSFYKKTCNDSAIARWFLANDINEKNLKTNYWKFVPLFIKMQQELSANNVKSFNVFPIYSHGLKYISYDSRCFHELLRRIDPKNTPSAWMDFSTDTKKYWRRWFNVPKNFGYSFSTDGVCVSLSMNRIIKLKEKHKSKRVKIDEAKSSNTEQINKRYKRIIAVDPGAKTPIVTCTRTGSGDFVYKMLKKQRVAYETKEHSRENKRLKYVNNIDQRIKLDRESLNKELGYEISRRNEHIHEYIQFQLKWFDEKQKLYEQRRVQRLKFDRYINDQVTNNKIVDEYFGKEPDTLVVYGSGFDFMNKSSFKGHRKFRHNNIIKIIKQRENLSLYIINEAFTTKNCSKCYETKNQNTLKVSKSPHRYVYCSICRKGIHRDKNGAKNILLKYEYKLPSILSFTGTDMDFI